MQCPFLTPPEGLPSTDGRLIDYASDFKSESESCKMGSIVQYSYRDEVEIEIGRTEESSRRTGSNHVPIMIWWRIILFM